MTESDDRPPLLVLLGPTASGKTSLALDLADQLPGGGELIGADSMQIYRGMDVGTAKPTPAERARAPHHLIDFVDPHHDRFTAHDWVTRANETNRGHPFERQRPIVVGGTNLYVRGLLEGLLMAPDPTRNSARGSRRRTTGHCEAPSRRPIRRPRSDSPQRPAAHHSSARGLRLRAPRCPGNRSSGTIASSTLDSQAESSAWTGRRRP